MKTVSLPFYDATGDLTPLVIEAMANGATSALGIPNETVLLTFDKAADAKAFEAKVGALAVEIDAPGDDKPADPVDDKGGAA